MGSERKSLRRVRYEQNGQLEKYKIRNNDEFKESFYDESIVETAKSHIISSLYVY